MEILHSSNNRIHAAPLRILMLYPAGVGGGSLSVVNDLVAGLPDYNIEVHFGVVGANMISIRAGDKETAHISRKHRLLFLADVRNLAHYVRQHNITLIHSHLSTFVLAALTARYAGLPSIRTIHGRLDRPGMLAFMERVPFWLTTHLLAQKVIAVSSDVASDLTTHYRLKSECNLFTIPNGYNPAHLPSRIPIADDVCVFGFVGRFEDAKGFPELIHAFTRLHTAYPYARLLLIGGGVLKDSIPDTLLSDGIIQVSDGWLAREEALRLLAATTHVFVLPSHSEGLSIALLEAMALGIVPIVSDAANGNDIVIDGLNGYVFPTGDATALFAKMEMVLHARVMLAEYGQRARTKVETEYRFATTLQNHYNVYLNIVHRDTRGSLNV